MSSQIRVRFAPSPTGRIHVGNLRTAVFNLLFARRHGGALLLRVEDTDRSRSTPEAEAQLFEALRWLGIDWDPEGEEGFYRQSRHHHRHMAVAEEWLKTGTAYRSARTTGEFAGGPGGAAGENGGDTLTPADEDGGDRGTPAGEAIWLRVEPRDLAYDDLIQGMQTQPAKQARDFVLVRSNGQPGFIFANAVDDADMHITHVLRGVDHVSNTFRQLQVYRALGIDPPRFGHMPLIVDKQGKKLSKREGDPDSIIYLDEFRERGYLPEALFNYLALLGWSPAPGTAADGGPVFREKLSRQELIAEFDLERVGRAPAQFDIVKLGAMNYDYIVERLDRDPASLVDHLKRDVRAEGLDPERIDATQYRTLIREAAQRARTLRELIDRSRFFFTDRVEVDAGHRTVRKVFGDADVWPRLEAAIRRLEAIPAADWKRDRIETALKSLAEELAGGRLGDVAQPVRILVAGGPASPAIDVTLELVGRERTLKRLRDEGNLRRLRAPGGG